MRPLIDCAETIRIDRPAEEAFVALADIDRLFAALQRKSPITVERLSGGPATAVGDRWRVSGDLKLGRRSGVVEITKLMEPTSIAFRTEGSGYLAKTEIAISPEGTTACRLSARNRIFADSLKARLAAPFIRLYRKRIERGFRKLLKRAKRRLEARS
ncbi:MAG: SRPBCC family protein [Pseudomonadota bacterium]